MKTLLTCENIERSYLMGKTRVKALRGVDLTIKKGELQVPQVPENQHF